LITNDIIDEPNESFTGGITGAVNGIISIDRADFTIMDNDTTP
jgi:hypothetical protein